MLNNFEGTKFENELIYEHNNAAGGRLLASFDKNKFRQLIKRLNEGSMKLTPTPENLKVLQLLANTEPSHGEVLKYLRSIGIDLPSSK